MAGGGAINCVMGGIRRLVHVVLRKDRRVSKARSNNEMDVGGNIIFFGVCWALGDL